MLSSFVGRKWQNEYGGIGNESVSVSGYQWVQWRLTAFNIEGAVSSDFLATQRLVRWSEWGVKRRFDSSEVAFPGKGRWLRGFSERGRRVEGAPSGGSVQFSCGGGGMWKNDKIAPLLVQTYQSSTEICLVCSRVWGTGMGRCKWFIIKGRICWLPYSTYLFLIFILVPFTKFKEHCREIF